MKHKIHRSKIFILLGTIAMIGSFSFNGARAMEDLFELERFATGLFVMRRNAERGDALSQVCLAVSYRLGGDGLEKDFKKAAYWFLQAAQQGNVHGQAGLGNIYNIGGFGVEKDDTLADYWYQKAAEQGYAGAIEFLSKKKEGQSVTDSTGQDMDITIGRFYKIVNKEKGWNLNVNNAHMEESSQDVTSQVSNGNYDSHGLFKFIWWRNGYYLIENKGSEKVISVQNADSKEKRLSVKAQPKDRKSKDHQLFRFIPQGSGYYLIENKQSGKLLNVWNAFNGFASWLDTTAEPNDNWWLNHRSFKFEPEPSTGFVP
ncbi:MAG TPA: RICIN domain-containing protein [Alphaproteobacteria bacterium]|nr:RICIN domain-containing protein [Alphaproteobacteria bacterium]